MSKAINQAEPEDIVRQISTILTELPNEEEDPDEYHAFDEGKV